MQRPFLFQRPLLGHRIIINSRFFEFPASKFNSSDWFNLFNSRGIKFEKLNIWLLWFLIVLKRDNSGLFLSTGFRLLFIVRFLITCIKKVFCRSKMDILVRSLNFITKTYILDKNGSYFWKMACQLNIKLRISSKKFITWTRVPIFNIRSILKFLEKIEYFSRNTVQWPFKS